MAERVGRFTTKMRAILARGTETDAVEFKETYVLKKADGSANHHQRAELVRDIMALANGEYIGDETTAYLFLGVRDDGSVVDAYSPFFADSADLQQLINDPLQRKVHFKYEDSTTEDGKTFGVIIIPPSTQRPHVVIRDCVPDETGRQLLLAGECWVRAGASKKRALAEDYDRIYEGRAQRRVQEAISAQAEGFGKLFKDAGGPTTQPSPALTAGTALTQSAQDFSEEVRKKISPHG